MQAREEGLIAATLKAMDDRFHIEGDAEKYNEQDDQDYDRDLPPALSCAAMQCLSLDEPSIEGRWRD